MNRITQRDLDGMVLRLNRLTNSPVEPWRIEEGRNRANPLHYHIDSAYGGHKLARMCNDGGGVETVLHTGYVSKRELYDAIYTFIQGIEQGKQLSN